MDWTFVEWRHQPITFVAWGNVGGARAADVSLFAPLEPELELMIDDLPWWMKALTPAREREET